MLKKNLLLSGGVLMILCTGIAHGTEFRVLSRLNVKDDEFTTKVTEIQQFTERSKLNKARLNYLFYLKSKCKIERSNNNPDVPKLIEYFIGTAKEYLKDLVTQIE